MEERIPFVGRDSQVATIRSWIDPSAWSIGDRNARICAITGPGGVGKSRLFREALTRELVAAGAYLMIELQGHRHRRIQQLFEWFRVITATTREPLPRTERCLRWHDELLARADELQWEDPDGEDVRGVVKKLISAGMAAGRGVGLRISALEIDESARHLEAAVNLLKRPSGLRRFYDGPGLRGFSRSPTRALADALVADLEALLSGARAESSRLLLILDDFEWIDAGMGEFLHAVLVPRLGAAMFRSVVLLVSRDRIQNVRGGIWQQSETGADLAARSLALRPLTHDDVLEYCAGLGLSREVGEHVALESQGYPWLVEMVAEEASTAGLPATAYQNFFTRTTRFMSDEQVTWFKAVAFLDIINEDTIPRVLPEADATRVYQWFINEPSIRDSDAPHYVVWPFIRYRILRLQWLRSPGQFRALHEASGCQWPLNPATQEPLRPGERAGG
ncbi:MAG: AAA family ATPase [Myxococcales bacterium]|nr:AAA family ATPase [Myxococcales bacterium]MCB9749594.1 AAA family ATPase [Myxococcales bacterium]